MPVSENRNIKNVYLFYLKPNFAVDNLPSAHPDSKTPGRNAGSRNANLFSAKVLALFAFISQSIKAASPNSLSSKELTFSYTPAAEVSLKTRILHPAQYSLNKSCEIGV